jgi:hypothetical protein
VSGGSPTRPPLSPKEAWLSDGRQVLHCRPTLWDRWNQRLVITSGELLADQPVPLLKKRWELSRQEEANEGDQLHRINKSMSHLLIRATDAKFAASVSGLSFSS